MFCLDTRKMAIVITAAFQTLPDEYIGKALQRLPTKIMAGYGSAQKSFTCFEEIGPGIFLHPLNVDSHMVPFHLLTFFPYG